ncbi:MAG: ankyrin repeat domain-containing protein [Paramuribaculum sp.]|nr:ankyrin repeat domain-containing protein [Paramuribaculum sp.]
MKTIPFILSICLLLTCSCRRNKTFHSIDSFHDTPVWQLAKLVKAQDTSRIKEYIESHPFIDIDTQDSEFHKNLLIWTIFNGYYDAFKTLLQSGANPNFVSSHDGTTPLIYASKYLSYNYQPDTRYIETLLLHGADPNIITVDACSGLSRNPLSAAATTSVEYVKLLIEKGNANPFLKINNITPVEQAVIQNQLETVQYLISSFDVSLSIPSGTYGGNKTVLDILKDTSYPEGSKLHFQKQQILASQENNSHLTEE